jgi:hypothetical protein
MPESKTFCCQDPEIAKQDPKDCSPEQIEECHGDAKEHPCESEPQGEK